MAYIDALRGAACVWVMLHHVFTVGSMANSSTPKLVAYTYVLGYLGVNLFLVLSGFCLFYPLTRKNTVADIQIKTALFFRRRARRILPPYYAALILCGLLGLIPYAQATIPTARGWLDVLVHALMAQNLFAQYFDTIDPVSWSLALEWQLYLIFPLLVLLARRFGLIRALIGTLLISLAWKTLALQVVGIHPAWGIAGTWYYALPGRCFEFAAGMMAADFVARPRSRQSDIASLIMVLALGPALWYSSNIGRFGIYNDQLWGLVFAAMIVRLGAAPNHVFQSGGALSIFSWLGVRSYSIYLVHLPVWCLVVPKLAGMHYLVLTGAMFLFALPPAILFFNVFERFTLKRPADA